MAPNPADQKPMTFCYAGTDIPTARIPVPPTPVLRSGTLFFETLVTVSPTSASRFDGELPTPPPSSPSFSTLRPPVPKRPQPSFNDQEREFVKRLKSLPSVSSSDPILGAAAHAGPVPVSRNDDDREFLDPLSPTMPSSQNLRPTSYFEVVLETDLSKGLPGTSHVAPQLSKKHSASKSSDSTSTSETSDYTLSSRNEETFPSSKPYPSSYQKTHSCLLPRSSLSWPLDRVEELTTSEAERGTTAATPLPPKGNKTTRKRTPLPNSRPESHIKHSHSTEPVAFEAFVSERGVLRTVDGVTRHYDALGTEIPMPDVIDRFRAEKKAAMIKLQREVKKERELDGTKVVKRREQKGEDEGNSNQTNHAMSIKPKVGKNAGRLPRRGAGVGFKPKVSNNNIGVNETPL